jgi:hypothetical protein
MRYPIEGFLEFLIATTAFVSVPRPPEHANESIGSTRITYHCDTDRPEVSATVNWCHHTEARSKNRATKISTIRISVALRGYCLLVCTYGIATSISCTR